MKTTTKKNSQKWLFLWVLIFFISMFSIIANEELSSFLAKESYSLRIDNVNKENKWSTVTQQNYGLYMHPGESNPVISTIKFNDFSFIKISISIKDTSTHGDILYTIKKNENIVVKKEIKAKKEDYSTIFFVTPYDQISIEADKNGHTGQDWGIVEIKEVDFDLILASSVSLILWISFLVFLYKRNQSSTAISYYIILLLFIIAESRTFGEISPKSLLACSSILLAFSIISSAFFQILSQKKNGKTIAAIFSIIFSLILYLVPASFIVYLLSFDAPATKETVNAIFQTNFIEGIEFIYDFITLNSFLFFFGVATVISYIFWWHRKSSIIFIEKNTIGLVLILAISIVTVTYQNIKIPRFVIDSALAYQAELDLFRTQSEKRKVDISQVQAQKNEKGELYIVVIGESHNKNHMQIYGYPRETTPNLNRLLKQDEIIKFEHAYSSHTHTMPVLSMALTEAAQDKKKDYYNSYSIVEILNTAGFQSTWLTNQNLFGAWDNLVSIIAHQSNKLIGINHSIGATTENKKFDGGLIPYLQEELERNSDHNRVIFLHLMGSHGTYCSRYPEDFNKFTNPLSIDDFGTALSTSQRHNIINCYDNSVLYNDHVLYEILESIKKSNQTASLLYFSDHSEDVIRGLGHNSGQFTFDMTQTPMFFWFSESYKEKYPQKVENLSSRRYQLFSNDRIYDTIIGWTNTQTDFYRSDFDLSSPQYFMDENNAYTLHGVQAYTDPKNHFYWQSKNLQALHSSNLGTKIFTHRVNSKAKLAEIWSNGARSFEVNLLFDYNKDGKFTVGHNDGVMGSEFQNLMEQIDASAIEKIWLDVKNLNASNAEQIFAELERLDHILQLKNKAILESGWTHTNFSLFADAGWHTSYYLPTTKLLAALEKNDLEALNQYAIQIASQVRSQQAGAISFDTRLYPFVKDHLESQLDNHIIYHVWYGPNLYDPNLFTQLKEKPIYQDPRVRSFLSNYRTHFNL